MTVEYLSWVHSMFKTFDTWTNEYHIDNISRRLFIFGKLGECRNYVHGLNKRNSNPKCETINHDRTGQGVRLGSGRSPVQLYQRLVVMAYFLGAQGCLDSIVTHVRINTICSTCDLHRKRSYVTETLLKAVWKTPLKQVTN